MTSVSTKLASGKTAAVEQRARRQSFGRVPGYVLAYIVLVLGVIVSLFPYFLGSSRRRRGHCRTR